MKQIRVTINPAGATTVAVECGVVGQDCQALTRRIEQALGTVTNDTPTEAMYQDASETVDA